MNAQVNDKAVVQVAQQFQNDMVRIAKAFAERKTHTADGKGKGDTIKKHVLAYARDTAAAGVPASVANTALRETLIAWNLPKGTALNYGRAVEGFRKIEEAGKLPNGKPIPTEGPTMASAQQAMESGDTKAKNEARTELAGLLKNASLKDIQALVTYAQEIGLKPKATKAGPVKFTIPELVEEGEEQQQAQAA